MYLAPIAGVVMFSVPFCWLLTKRALRLKKILGAAAGRPELVARALRAGHSLGAGMHVVAEEMPAPVCDEFNAL